LAGNYCQEVSFLTQPSPFDFVAEYDAQTDREDDLLGKSLKQSKKQE